MRSEKPTDIVAMLRHFFRVTAVEEGCAVRPTKVRQVLPSATFARQVDFMLAVLE